MNLVQQNKNIECLIDWIEERKAMAEQEGIEWINNKLKVWDNAIKPCRFCGFCPYGQMVEMSPLDLEPTYRSCEVFGHDCPVYYHAEPFSEETNNVTDEECLKWDTEMQEKFFKEE